MSWIQSFSGKRVDPFDLRPEQVAFADIPIALARKPRFQGHTIRPYSVAEHCVRGAQLIEGPFKLAFLLHEVSEVYLPDVPTPIKRALRYTVPGCSESTVSWEHLEAVHARVICEALGLASLVPLLTCPEVREMDAQMLATEARDVMGPAPEDWGLKACPLAIAIDWWEAGDWAKGFRETYEELRAR